MCEFPSWIVDKDGKAHWLVDADIVAAMDDGKLAKGWFDSTGHSAMEQVLGIKGEHREGREGLPAGFASDIKSGRCNRMARVEPRHALKYVPDLLPPGLQLFGSEYKGGLDLRGCDLKGITLPTSVGGGLDLSGAKNVVLPVGLTVGDDLYLTDSDVTSLPHGFSIKGRVIGKDLPILPKDEPKKKRGAKGKKGGAK